MQKSIPVLASAVLLIAGPAAAAETWQPLSKTALSITGRVQFSPTRITFQNGKFLPIAAATPEGIDGQVFKVLRPGDPVLIRGNKLCGSAPVTFVVISKGNDGERNLSVFTTASEPGQETSACASYSFKAGR